MRLSVAEVFDDDTYEKGDHSEDEQETNYDTHIDLSISLCKYNKLAGHLQ